MIMVLQRKRKTKDGIFGCLVITNPLFTSFTVENLIKAIKPGIYNVDFTYSPRFEKVMPHIIDPERDDAAGGDAGLRIHPANLPEQLQGCVAVGDHENPNSIDNSKKTFDILFSIIKDEKDLKIDIRDIVEV